MVRFVEGVEDMEQLSSFRMHELYQMQMMNQYRPVEELPDNQNGTDKAGPTENGVEDVEMPLASSGEPEPKPKPKPETEPDYGNITQEDDASIVGKIGRSRYRFFLLWMPLLMIAK